MAGTGQKAGVVGAGWFKLVCECRHVAELKDLVRCADGQPVSGAGESEPHRPAEAAEVSIEDARLLADEDEFASLIGRDCNRDAVVAKQCRQIRRVRGGKRHKPGSPR